MNKVLEYLLDELDNEYIHHAKEILEELIKRGYELGTLKYLIEMMILEYKTNIKNEGSDDLLIK